VLLSATKGVNDEILEDIIPIALDSVDQLEELCLRLKDLWSQYGFKGRKAKRPFKELAICKVVSKYN
jgi:hypothetical protein